MSTDSTPRPESTTDRPTAFCSVRSEPIDHSRVYSVTTSLDVLQTSGLRRQQSTDIDEVLRIVARFLRESSP